MPEYLIRLFKDDGSLSLVVGLRVPSVDDARSEARFLLDLCHMERADIWAGERILARLTGVVPHSEARERVRLRSADLN